MKRYSKHILLGFTLLALLTGCSSNLQNQRFSPLILDEAGIFSQETATWLQNYNYPNGFAFIVRTVKTLPQDIELGSRADDYFEADADKCPNPDACKRRGVYIILSQEPALIQVRVGSEIAAQSRWAGITAGAIYIQKQSIVSSGDFDGGLREMVEWLSSSLPQATKVPWYRRWLLNEITQGLWLELDQLSLPSESFYGHYVLKPFVQARVIESQLVGTWWLTYVIAAMVIFVFKRIVQKFVGGVLGILSQRVANGINLILAIVFDLALAVPSAASVILLSGSRLEDQIALQAWGIPGISTFSFSAQLFNVETGLLFALLVLVIRWLNGLGESAEIMWLASFSDEKQQTVYEQLKQSNPLAAWFLEGYVTSSDNLRSSFYESPFGTAAYKIVLDNFAAGIKWALLAWLFLPRALSLAMVFIWIPSLLIGLPKFIIAAMRVSRV